MPAELLPGLEMFTSPGRPMYLNGEPWAVMAGARRYTQFAADCVTAASVIRSLDSSRFQGDEAEAFRGKFDEHLPGWLDVTGRAHEVVGAAIKTFGGVFEGDHSHMQVIRSQAPGSHGAVQAAAKNVNRLETQLVADRAAESVAQADHAASVNAAALGAATPAGPGLAAKEGQAAATASAATAKANETQAELTAAWAEYRRARGVWDALLADAEGIHVTMHDAAKVAQDVIDDQKGVAFEENPSGISGFFSKVGDWLDEHADLLKTLSDILTTIGGIVAMFPGIGTAIGAALIGVGMLMKLALTLNGNMSWGEFAMSSLDAIPGLGKAAQVGKLAKLGRVCKNDPVDVFSGDVVDVEVDFRIDGAFPFAFERGLMTSFRAGRSFGPSWVSVFDSCVEVTESGVVFIGPDGLGIEFDHPVGDSEVVSVDTAGWRLSFVDGAYRVRDVAAGVTYVYSMVGEFSSVTMPDVEDGAAKADADESGQSWESSATMSDSSLAAVTGFSVVVALTAAVHHSGHGYEVEYDRQSGLPDRVRLTGGAVVSVACDQVSGRVVGLSVADEGGAPLSVVRYEYSVGDELVAVFAGDGVPLRYTYDSAGRVSSWSDRNGMTYRYVYDEAGRCVAQAGTGGVYANATVYLPDTGPGAAAGGRLSVMIQTAAALDVGSRGDDAAAIARTLEAVDALDLVAALTERGLAGAGVVLPDRVMTGGADHRDAAGLVFADVDPSLWRDEVLGDVRCEIYRCDRDGDVWQSIDAAGGVTTRELSRRLVVREVAPDGGVSVLDRDADGLVLAESGPGGVSVRVDYGGLGVPTRVVDGAGRVTEFEVDAVGNVVSVTDPAGLVTRREFEYRVSGSVLSRIVDPSGAVTEIDCDGAGRPLRVIDPSGRAVSYDYDVFGNVTSIMDPDGRQTRQSWNARGDLVERVHPDGSRESATYDAEGNLVASVDEVGGRRTSLFGPMDSPVEMVDAAGGRIGVRYDTQLQVREVVNPDGHSWTFDYDRAGRLIGETDYNGARTSYRLDACGRVVERVDALGRAVVNEYDAAGRLWAFTSDVDGRTEFTFSAAGQMVRAVNADAVVDFEYDPASGVLVGETVNGISARWRPDPVGRTSVRTVELPAEVAGGGRWESLFAWDQSGLLQQVSTTADRSTAGVVDGLRFAYDGSGREVSRAVGARAVVAQRFDVRDRLIEQVVSALPSPTPAAAGAGVRVSGRRAAGSLAVVAGRSWSYRADSYVESVRDVRGGSAGFSVDAQGRITAAVPASGAVASGAVASGVVVSEGFGYSPAGVLDRVSGGLGVAGVASSPRSGPAASGGDRSVAVSGTLVTRIGADRFVYDGAGQLVERRHQKLSRKPEVTRFTYTGAGQIRSVVTSSGSVWRYGYDAFGRRVSKTHTGADGAVLDEVVFGWDGDDVVSQTSVACSDRPGAVSGAASSLVWVCHPDTGEPLEQHARHVTPDGVAGSGRVEAGAGRVEGWSQARVDDEFFAIVSDLALAPTELIDPGTGQVVGVASRSVWGRTRWSGVSTPLRFAGQQYDAESGLHYNRHRFYDPETASYTSPDPLGVAPNLASATAYVHNPHTWVDPLGLKMCEPGVYGLFNKRTGELEYIGKASRFSSAKSRHAANPFRKHLKFEILEEMPGSSKNLRTGVEQAYMNRFPHTSAQLTLFKGKGMATGNVNASTRSSTILANGNNFLIGRHGSLSNLDSHVSSIGRKVLEASS